MSSSLKNRRIVFTSPASYGEFLRSRLAVAGAIPIWLPTLQIQFGDRTKANIRQAIAQEWRDISGIAFTSRNGIHAVAQALDAMEIQPLPAPFLLGALGKDTEALSALDMLTQHSHCQVICPAIATPQALVETLGDGQDRKILCPVPEVIGLPEPNVVPRFLQALRDTNWHPIRVNAYETKRVSSAEIAPIIDRIQTNSIDALIFTSTAEASSFIKNCQTLGIPPQQVLQDCVVATHGPVTAHGVEKLGLTVTVISQNSASFGGVILALEQYFTSKA